MQPNVRRLGGRVLGRVFLRLSRPSPGCPSHVQYSGGATQAPTRRVNINSIRETYCSICLHPVCKIYLLSRSTFTELATACVFVRDPLSLAPPRPASATTYNNMIQEMKPCVFKAIEQENAKEE